MHPNEVRGLIESEHCGLRDAREKEYVADRVELEAVYRGELAVLRANEASALVAAGFGPGGAVPPNWQAVVPINAILPAITGTELTEETLTCDDGTWINADSYTYQWYQNDTAIDGATDNEYEIVIDDEGQTLTCRVTASNEGGSASADSNTVEIEDPTPAPVNTLAPAVTGTTETGETVTCSTGTWDNADSYTYQWVRNGTPIGGATANTRVLVMADEGTNLKCVVTATGTGGTASEDSNTINPTA